MTLPGGLAADDRVTERDRVTARGKGPQRPIVPVAAFLVQTYPRRGRFSLWVFGLAMAGNLLTAMVALEAVGSGGSPEGPERSEGAAERLDAPLPTVHAPSHMP